MPFPSRVPLITLLAALGVLPWAGVPAPPRLHPVVAAADTVLVREGEVVDEDLYALGQQVIVQGRVTGDLVVAAGELRMVGRVEGDINGVASRAVIGGQTDGSVRLVSGEVIADGAVGQDLVVLAGSVTLDGEVNRDLLALTNRLQVRGAVGRDVRGQMGSLNLSGRVGRDVEVALGGSSLCRRLPGLPMCRGSSVSVRPTARVGGDIGYRSFEEAQVSAAAEVEGQVIRRRPTPANVTARAGARVLSFLWFLAFVVTGVALLGLLPATSIEAVAVASLRPWRAALLGLAVLVLVPIVAVLLSLSVVGLPLGLLLLALWVLGLFAGPVPAVNAVGQRVLGDRGGRYGGFLLGSVLWALLRLIPVLGGLVYLVTLVWGLGGWASGSWTARRWAAEGEERDRAPLGRHPPS